MWVYFFSICQPNATHKNALKEQASKWLDQLLKIDLIFKFPHSDNESAFKSELEWVPKIDAEEKFKSYRSRESNLLINKVNLNLTLQRNFQKYILFDPNRSL